MDRPRYWFAAKELGWGWGWPLAWQGWLAYASAAALLVASFVVFPPAAAPLRFVACNAGVVVALLLACWLKGEPLR
ncbi:MAG: hypothetical protein ABS96_05585 [Lysobacteraceae bacterium SCN 69-123]|uniref:hypothetical protein n=1 Tax=Stenotrophomonas acidaminiphila TaxID=128780 RepID=UPI00086F231E|nr:hypothetical protein [Stenotrophomonas acidaminiphila]MBN8800134.1 hypothetical protein [Stenotrophomonas acidaminiphila]MDF9441648.1 hypothetical protein [Stenotrophomonas acidaminiphila]ODU47515.1 MAG: hypothetical protein ABS96_05585 [Xanthomonadaceae bacterium SCN 69-123]OJY80186.1 MAG: hypothetical protein BGP18_14820 [Stenotrophomonas sp. 69-14]